MYLLAPTILRVAPTELPVRVRARFADQLRRAGGFVQLCVLGAQACLDTAGGGGRIGVLWATELGAVDATRAVLNAELRRGEPIMPFAFIATQPHLAGAQLAQRPHPVSRTALLHLGDDAWSWLPLLARSWLAECERVLVGWVEESDAPDVAHRSDWCLFQTRGAAGSLRCETASNVEGAVAATARDWIARVAAWHCAPQVPLLLRGDEDAWRFTSDG